MLIKFYKYRIYLRILEYFVVCCFLYMCMFGGGDLCMCIFVFILEYYFVLFFGYYLFWFEIGFYWLEFI